MRMRFAVALVVWAVLALPVFGQGIKPQLLETTPVEFEKWGFKVGIPTPYEKQPPLVAERAELAEAYVCNGLFVAVLILPVPSKTLTSTAIEQTIQAIHKAPSASGTAHRWELDSKQGELFKAVSWTLSIESGNVLGGLPVLQTILAGRTGLAALCMAPLRDESSPILAIAVVGSLDRAKEIENAATFVAYTVVTRPPLKKGQIELVGVIDAVNVDENSFTMTVDQVTMPGGTRFKLDPPRPKTVFIKKGTPGFEVGARVLIIGKNEGVGKPITADVAEGVNLSR